MSLHKLTAGTGYTYLTRQVAAHDRSPAARASLASYYTEQGETPGRWLGTGLVGIDGLAPGDEVTEDQMRSLFGAGLHPLATQRSARLEGPNLTQKDLRAATRLGTPYKVYTHDSPHFLVEVARRIEDHAAALGHPRHYPVDHDTKAAIRSAVATEMFTAEHSRAPSGARELAAAVARYSRPRTRAVGGYDLTFSPVKSVSALWALAPPEVAAQVERAHHDAVRDALTYLETHALFTREGTDGVRQVETTGLIAAAFTHRDSRAGDPDLHTHVAVANKVQARGSGSWLAIDGRLLYKAHVSASETYNTALEAHLRRRLGVQFAPRPSTSRDARPVREITGIAPALLARWSTRRRAIDTRRGELAHTFQGEHGRPPTSAEAIHLAQQATLETRGAKHPPRRFSEQRTAWRREAEEALGDAAAVDAMLRAVTAVARHDTPRRPDPAWLRETAREVLTRVQSERSTWQVWHIRAEALRQVRGADIASVDLEATVRAVTHTALAASVRLAATDDGITEPPPLRRSDGSSVYDVAGATLYTSAAILAAEQRIVTAAGIADRPTCAEDAVSLTLLEHAANGAPLNPGQRALVRGMATSGARAQLALAPAGAGKTTAMQALTSAWIEGGGTVIGLAPSAAAASVLRESTGTATDTLAKLTWSLTRPEADRPDWVRDIGSRTLVILDEAAMADTLSLDAAISYVVARGGQVRLIGDTHQLGAIGAGGVLRDIADTHGALHLSELMRFTDPAEGLASLALREGRPEALGYYLDNQRVHVGDLTTTTEQAFTAWARDRDAGRDTLLLAPTRDLVAGLNQRAQAHHLGAAAAGHGALLADGAQGHVGDIVITRRNDRRLPLSSTDWVKNGDRWTIETIAPDGSLGVCHSRTRQRTTLPAGYVRDSVELGYATTVHAAQGISVDTVHGLATGTENRQLLYTLLTRGADANHLYLQLAADGDPHSVIRPEATHPATATDVLEAALSRDEAPRSATTLEREAAAPATLLHAAVSRYADALHLAATRHLGPDALTDLDRAADTHVPGIGDDPAWPTLRSHLTLLAAMGRDPVDALRTAVGVRDLNSAADQSAVLTWRLDDAALHYIGPGPLPWLPAIPTLLEHDEECSAYLHARCDLVTKLARQVRLEAQNAGAPPWWPTGVRPDKELLADVLIWRAAHGVPDSDHRPTGLRERTKAPALWQRALDARLGTHSPALAEWGDLLHRLFPGTRDDDFTPHLAQRLAAVHRAGLDARALVQSVVHVPLPDDHAAAALWWRISRHLSPAVAHHIERGNHLGSDWVEKLTDGLSPEVVATLRGSPWWPALVASLEHAIARGTPPHDLKALLSASTGIEADLDLCQALTWRLSLLTDPPVEETVPRPEDYADTTPEWQPPPESPATDVHSGPPRTRLVEDVQSRLTAAALVRSAMGVLPPSDAEIEQMVARAAAWDDAPFTPERAAHLNALARGYYASLLDTAWAGDYLRTRLRVTSLPDGIGYAPPGWTHLTNRLRSLGASGEELLAVGLSSRTQRGTLIDRFRDRLVLPIVEGDNVVGFVGRRSPEADHTHGPKYLNTPTTALFHKGDVLYGVDQAAIVGGATPVLVEGPIDALAITLASAGSHIGLSPLGTAVTPAQARQIAGLHDAPIVAFDADSAGTAASVAAYWALAQHSVTPRSVTLPAGSDPADLIAQKGHLALRRVLASTQPLAAAIPLMGDAEHDLGVLAASEPAAWLSLVGKFASNHNIDLDRAAASAVDTIERWNRAPSAAAEVWRRPLRAGHPSAPR
ncbi:MobF family relaxase [Phycicoccus avicenniae]|uniref:MobF family relaxase n=1 Tax=Phycicoccus avicenniae TaxID=2828860 RepID=UPI003D27E2E8